jgi:arylsulfatase A-like enzyme/Tfp pilus assembly protein PilF
MRASRTLVLAAAGTLVAGAAAAYFLSGPRGPKAGRPPRGRDLNVIVVTLDTTRADSLSCYGSKEVRTPTIDGFAARGVLFETCYTQTPLTLPAHTTLMTGTLPPFHGVRDNGGYVVPQDLVTMAELFRDKGYETGAFVGAWVLDGKWGLNQGFGTYFDDFDLRKFANASFDTVRRPANEVLDAALPWLEARKSGKFFAWIHLYDPHSPYAPPPPFDTQYAGRPYLGAIAFMDSELGRLRSFLDRNGLLGNSIVVIAGDHGESLGEHGELTHGFFVYQAALHVPLIVVAPGTKRGGTVSEGPAGLVDVLPTVCELAGLAAPAEVQGASLVPRLAGRRGNKPSAVYSETYYPLLHYGWSDLKCVQDGRYKVILAPRPELYDVVDDPAEEKDLVDLRKEVYEGLKAKAEAIVEAAGHGGHQTKAAAMDAATRERLAALGYVGSFTDPAALKGKAPADPKDRIAVYNGLTLAQEMETSGRPDEAIRIVRGILAADAGVSAVAYDILGAGYMAKNDFGPALESLRKALELDAGLPNVHYRIGWIAEKQGRLPEAEAEYLREIEISPGHFKALYNLARVYDRTGNHERERETLLECIKADPKFPQTYLYLARLDLARSERYPEAIDLALKGLALEPAKPELAAGCFLLAELYRRVGDEARSREYAAKGRALAAEDKKRP